MCLREGKKKYNPKTDKADKNAFLLWVTKEVKFFLSTLYAVDIIASSMKKKIFLWFVALAVVTDL